jgi:transposase-like protein
MSESTKPRKRKQFRPQSEWQRIIDDYQRSGLTQEAFCEQASIPKSSFYKWRKRLETPAVADEPAQFLDLNTLVKSKEPPRWEIELDLGNGMRLSLRGG